MPSSFANGDSVRWKWGRGYADGVVFNIYPRKATCSADGSETTRHGNEEDPVLHILTPGGHSLVKLSSEVECGV